MGGREVAHMFFWVRIHRFQNTARVYSDYIDGWMDGCTNALLLVDLQDCSRCAVRRPASRIVLCAPTQAASTCSLPEVEDCKSLSDSGPRAPWAAPGRAPAARYNQRSLVLAMNVTNMKQPPVSSSGVVKNGFGGLD